MVAVVVVIVFVMLVVVDSLLIVDVGEVVVLVCYDGSGRFVVICGCR